MSGLVQHDCASNHFHTAVQSVSKYFQTAGQREKEERDDCQLEERWLVEPGLHRDHRARGEKNYEAEAEPGPLVGCQEAFRKRRGCSGGAQRWGCQTSSRPRGYDKGARN